MYRKLQGDPNEDFIKQNPEFEFLSSVQALPKKNRSKILWSAYMMHHPDSTLARTPEDVRRREIETTYYKPDWESLEDVTHDILQTTLTVSKQNFHKMAIAINRLGDHVMGMDPKEEAKDMAIMMEKWTKTWTAFKKIETEVEIEDAKHTLRGGGQMGARERRAR